MNVVIIKEITSRLHFCSIIYSATFHSNVYFETNNNYQTISKTNNKVQRTKIIK